MKNKLILTILLIVAAISAEGQLRYGFRFGGDFAKASLGYKPEGASSDQNAAGAGNASAAGLNGLTRLSNRSGFSGGLVLEYQFEKCGFAPDIALLYTRYNTRLILPGQNPRSFGRNFIEVPIHLKWKFWIPQTKNLFAPMIYTGPSLMFRLGHGDGVSYPYSDCPADQACLTMMSQVTFKSKVFQPGWDLGIGFDVINFIQITAGYRFGLGNAFSSPSDVTLHTNGWNVAATLLFDF